MKPNIPPDPHTECNRDLNEARAIARRLRDEVENPGDDPTAAADFDALPWAKEPS